jgi:hypothetical protein
MEIITIDPGRTVVCDDCNADYTDSPDTGGLLFGSRAICPQCQQKTRMTTITAIRTSAWRSYSPGGRNLTQPDTRHK